ncbi:MAG: Ppx/GppA phosphatase family protein [Verrucomicrobiia bacterium]|jgi:exopolyphosphatase/guanosine-5'-triphosphate,3'-diphosphate pyrophosphatase
MTSDRLAAIDIGTNTIKLLVAVVEGGALTALHEDSQTTRLGEGVAATKRLTLEAIERTAAGLAAFTGKARKMGVTKILAVATSGAREAENTSQFLARVREMAGLDVEIIGGEREAELIFAGVSTDAGLRDQRLLVMDVGGGSAEIITGQSGRIERRVSVHAGAVRLTERFLHSDPVSPADLNAMLQHGRELLQLELAKCSLDGRVMVGTGGTVTTAAAIDQSLARFSIEKVNRYSLTRQRLTEMLERLRSLPLAERRKVSGLPPKRADIIVAGLAMHVVAMELAGIERLTVSTRGLRFGVLAEMCGLLT